MGYFRRKEYLMMRRMAMLAVATAVLWSAGMGRAEAASKFRRLRMDDYVDKMMGGWIGQMGVVRRGGD